jgi:hypothetical protein
VEASVVLVRAGLPCDPAARLAGVAPRTLRESRSFYDLDGHGWQVMWMDPAAAEQGPEAFAAAAEDADAAA